MRKIQIFPMEMSILLMISVAIFLAHGDSPVADRSNNHHDSMPDRNSPGKFLEQYEVTDTSDKTLPDDLQPEQNNKNLSKRRNTISGHNVPFKELESLPFEEHMLGKRKNDKKQYSRKFKYDPALALMGLGKRHFKYDPALNYMGLGKRNSQYDPALKYMGLGKRGGNVYDPGLKYIGLGKRGGDVYDPGLKYIGLGKRGNGYDPGLKYMGLGKRGNGYDPGLKYMGLGKRGNSYDPGLKYMGLGKRDLASLYPLDLDFGDSDPLDRNPSGEFSASDGHLLSYSNPSIYDDIDKRQFKYDPALKYMGLGKRKYQYDPALQYMGLGKREDKENLHSGENAENSKQYIIKNEDVPYEESESPEFNKRISIPYAKLNYKNEKKQLVEDSFDKIPGLGKRPYKFDPGLRLMGLGKRYGSGKDITKFREQNSKFDPALKYMTLGKRKLSTNDRSEQFKNTNDKREVEYATANEEKSEAGSSLNRGENKRQMILNSEKKSLDNRKYIPTVMYMGLDKRDPKYDPALLYMGLGKRGTVFNPRLLYRADGDDNSQYDIARKFIDVKNPEVTQSEGNRKVTVDILELSKHSNQSKICGDRCLKRRKRQLRSSKEDLEESDFDDDKENNDIFPLKNSDSKGGISRDISEQKRERDNRPKYNPGWIFIGLGKRNIQPPELIIPAEEISDTHGKRLNYTVLFNDYYGILDEVNDNIQDVKHRLGKEWIPLQTAKGFDAKLPRVIPYELKEGEYMWSKATTPSIVMTGRNDDDLPPDTWMDFLPFISQIGK